MNGDNIIGQNQLMADGVIKFNCKKCNFENAFIVPKLEITNAITYSAAIAPHPEPQVCEGCGALYQFVIKSVAVTQLGIREMVAQSKTGLIVPPSGIVIPGGN